MADMRAILAGAVALLRRLELCLHSDKANGREVVFRGNSPLKYQMIIGKADTFRYKDVRF